MRLNGLYLKIKKLLQCSQQSFCCDDGRCIAMEQRCNEVTDCYDLSDENNCAMLDFDVNRYRNNYPPVSSDNSKV